MCMIDKNACLIGCFFETLLAYVFCKESMLDVVCGDYELIPKLKMYNFKNNIIDKYINKYKTVETEFFNGETFDLINIIYNSNSNNYDIFDIITIYIYMLTQCHGHWNNEYNSTSFELLDFILLHKNFFVNFINVISNNNDLKDLFKDMVYHKGYTDKKIAGGELDFCNDKYIIDCKCSKTTNKKYILSWNYQLQYYQYLKNKIENKNIQYNLLILDIYNFKIIEYKYEITNKTNENKHFLYI